MCTGIPVSSSTEAEHTISHHTAGRISKYVDRCEGYVPHDACIKCEEEAKGSRKGECEYVDRNEEKVE